MSNMNIAEVLRYQAALLTAVAGLCEKDVGVPLNEILDRLDRCFPRKESLGATEMAKYWGISEANARTRMHAVDFPAEQCGVRLVVSKVSLALYELQRSRCVLREHKNTRVNTGFMRALDLQYDFS